MKKICIFLKKAVRYTICAYIAIYILVFLIDWTSNMGSHQTGSRVVYGENSEEAFGPSELSKIDFSELWGMPAEWTKIDYATLWDTPAQWAKNSK